MFFNKKTLILHCVMYTVMKYLMGKYWIVSMFLFGFIFLMPEKQVQAQAYTDSITFKIDSARIEGFNLVYSVMFWRTNQDWRGTASAQQDTVLGNTDLYFWMKNTVFDFQNPVILRKHPSLGKPNDLLDITAMYYAERFRIQLKIKPAISSAMNVVGVPYNKPTELCKVQMSLLYNDRNPGFVWDTKATGGQSYSGEPLIADLKGDIIQNPDPSIVLEAYSGTQSVCQGGTAKIWARGHSTGSQLNTSWKMAKKLDFSDAETVPNALTGPDVGVGQVHYSNTISTKWGNLFYMVSATNTSSGSRVDTLIIPNAPAWIDSMYFQCILSDASLSVAPRKSTEGDTRLFLRDSIFAWFAASDPANRADGPLGIGAHDRTDTIFKCPSSESYVDLYFFGPKCGEDANTIGGSMTITYSGRDQLANPYQNTVDLSSWARVNDVLAPNGRCLYRGSVQLPDDLTNIDVWITSISTVNGCNNGASYAPYDTVHITDLAGNSSIKASLADTTLSSGESMALNSKYSYSNYYLKTPALGTLNLGSTPKKYNAPSDACTNPTGCRDTIVYQYKVGTSIGGDCTMEVEQVVHISDWFYVAPKVILEGAYRSSGKMSTYLSTRNLLPTASPYDNTIIAPIFPVGKAIVDWLNISLREESAPKIIVAETSVFLLEDGAMCDLEGEASARFKNLDPAKKYYIVIRHRNHLIARNKCAVTISQQKMLPTVIDFTQLANVAGEKLKSLPGGIYGLFAGDIIDDGIISGSDKSLLVNSAGSSGYTICDLDFDGLVSGTDKAIFLKNTGASASLNAAACP